MKMWSHKNATTWRTTKESRSWVFYMRHCRPRWVSEREQKWVQFSVRIRLENLKRTTSLCSSRRRQSFGMKLCIYSRVKRMFFRKLNEERIIKAEENSTHLTPSECVEWHHRFLLFKRCDENLVQIESLTEHPRVLAHSQIFNYQCQQTAKPLKIKKKNVRVHCVHLYIADCCYFITWRIEKVWLRIHLTRYHFLVNLLFGLITMQTSLHICN